MKKFLVLLAVLGVWWNAYAQIVTFNPPKPGSDGQEVTLTFDASQGTGALVGANKVYIHTGVVTDGPEGSAWNHVVGNWGKDDGVGEMTKVDGEANKWQITFSPDIRSYYNVPPEETIFRLSMVFRDASGGNEGKGTAGAFEGGFVADNQDIYLDLSLIHI